MNAGSGADEHPTQALLDIYTLQRSFQFDSPKDSPAANRFDELRERKGYAGLTKGLAQKTYGFCGDIGRGRTVRSLAMLLALYENVRLVFIVAGSSEAGDARRSARAAGGPQCAVL